MVLKKVMKFFLSFFLKSITLLIKRRELDIDSIEMVLFVYLKPLGIGDYFMNSPSIIEFKDKYPNKKLFLLTDRDFMIRSDLFEEIIIIEDIKTFLKRCFRLRKQFDLIILLNKNLLQSLYSLLLINKYLIGYFYSWDIYANFYLKNKFRFNIKSHYYHMGFNVVKNLEVKNFHWKIERLNFSHKERDYVNQLINKNNNKKIIVINPFVLWQSRTWPKENYLELIKLILKNEKYRIIITGGPSEIKYNSYFTIKLKDKVINLTGKLNLCELSALFYLSDLVITGDCGPMHIAISENTKVLSLWGPTDPLTRLPLDKINKRIFYLYNKKHPQSGEYNLESESKNNHSINTITTKEVFNKFLTVMK